MFAVVDIQGFQYKVEEGQEIYVNRLGADEGASVDFEKVLLVENGGDVKVGKPYLDGGKVTAKVVDHVKGDKIIVFHKKRRKGYRKKNGHRQALSKIEIESIVG